MWKNYLKMAWRQAFKRKGYSLLNIFGLAIGITSCLLILQYVAREWSYDNFHPKAGNIYRLRLDSYQNGKLAYQSATVFPAFAPTLKAEMAEVVNACRLHDAEMVITNPENNTKFSERKGYYADPPFLKMFGLKLLAGDPATALDGPDKILLSESMARKYFDRTDVLGDRIAERLRRGEESLLERFQHELDADLRGLVCARLRSARSSRCRDRSRWTARTTSTRWRSAT